MAELTGNARMVVRLHKCGFTMTEISKITELERVTVHDLLMSWMCDGCQRFERVTRLPQVRRGK